MTQIDPNELAEALQIIQDRKAAANAPGPRDVFFRCQVHETLADGETFPSARMAEVFNDGITALVEFLTEQGVLVDGSARFDIATIEQEFGSVLGLAVEQAFQSFIAKLGD